MRKILFMLMTACLFISCNKAKVEGCYAYQHGWNYDIKEGNIDVHETGTMDFYDNGSALDSARQVYTVSFNDGSKAIWEFNYVSPSRWRVENEDFYFAGIEESFRMELVENKVEGCDKESSEALAQRIIKSVTSSIDRETKFHLAKLTDKELNWSYTYPNGHTDTWKFYRQKE